MCYSFDCHTTYWELYIRYSQILTQLIKSALRFLDVSMKAACWDTPISCHENHNDAGDLAHGIYLAWISPGAGTQPWGPGKSSARLRYSASKPRRFPREAGKIAATVTSPSEWLVPNENWVPALILTSGHVVGTIVLEHLLGRLVVWQGTESSHPKMVAFIVHFTTRGMSDQQPRPISRWNHDRMASSYW